MIDLYSGVKKAD